MFLLICFILKCTNVDVFLTQQNVVCIFINLIVDLLLIFVK